MMGLSHVGETYDHPVPGRISLMTRIEKLRTLARELAGEACDYERRQLAAQAVCPPQSRQGADDPSRHHPT